MPMTLTPAQRKAYRDSVPVAPYLVCVINDAGQICHIADPVTSLTGAVQATRKAWCDRKPDHARIILLDTNRKYVAIFWTKGLPTVAPVPGPGYYLVDGKRYQVQVGKKNWEGWTFLRTGSAYHDSKTLASRAPDGGWGTRTTLHGRDVWAAIAMDELGAMAAYGHATGKCGRCNRLLEDAESVALGIGPVCRGKLGL